MKSKITLLTLLVACVVPAHGHFSYISELEDLRVGSGSIGCNIGEALVFNNHKEIVISTDVGSMVIPVDNMAESNILIIGDMTGDGYCDLAVPYAIGDVNESYVLFVYDARRKTLKKSKVEYIANPDFKGDVIVSSYRDAAQWYEDTLCYSGRLDDFFLCAQRKYIDNSLEWLKVCNKDSCFPSKIIYKHNSLQASAVVTVDRANLHDKNDDGILTERKGYLIKGDKVNLLDFFQSYDAFYYKIEYVSNKSTTIGWVESLQLAVVPSK